MKEIKPDEPTTANDANESRNFLVLTLYQVLLRTGWIFKTESIIMPAVLDTIAGQGWVRGLLPVLNRFGYSVPPLLMARRIKVAGRKKWSLLATTICMAVTFFGLAALFLFDRQKHGGWLPAAFLILYAIFFTAIGVNQLSFNTLQGKLIPANRRGRLLLVSNMIGAITAIACALLLLPHWLNDQAPRFDLVFSFCGVLFSASAVVTCMTVESVDRFQQLPAAVHEYFFDAGRLLVRDAAFRRLAFVGAMYGTSIMLFPHYQNLGLSVMKLKLSNLMWWVVVQNVGTALFSIPAGPLADRYGNRLVLKLGMLGIIAAPLLAVGLLHFTGQAQLLFNLVFLFVGLTPVVLRSFQNFALELSQPEDHPQYLSTISLLIACPIVFSPFAGRLVDRMGYEPVFLAIALMGFVGWLGCFGLIEPRDLQPKVIKRNSTQRRGEM
jgi:MFS family permease